MAKNRWYKEKVFYQIWPRSFCDGNGDRTSWMPVNPNYPDLPIHENGFTCRPYETRVYYYNN